MVRLLVVVVLSGCSLALSGPDPNAPKNQMPACDTGKGLVAADGVIGGALVLAGGVAAANNGGSAAILPLAFGAALIGSAVHGNSAVDQCRDAMTAYTDRFNSNELAAADRAEARQRLARRTLPNPLPPTVVPSVVQTQASPSPSPSPSPPPSPAPAPVVSPPPKPATQRPQPRPTEDPWADFWQEVP